MFWKAVKPRFSYKCKTANTIVLREEDTIMKNEKLIADTFNNYFADITKSLKLKKHPKFDDQFVTSITEYCTNNKSNKNQRKVCCTRELIYLVFKRRPS